MSENKKRKAAFIDRDGTINVDKGYVHLVEDFEYIDGALHMLKTLQNLGYILVIVTNQSGIARGYYTEEEFNKLNEWMLKDMEKKGIHISGVYYCPHLPDATISKYRLECDCRKPKIGLFLRAAEELNIDIDNSIVIGDKESDMCICNESKARGFLISDKCLKYYYMYEYTDKVKLFADTEQFPTILNYVKTGLLSEDEMIEALLYK